jgi:hypothetical protein
VISWGLRGEAVLLPATGPAWRWRCLGSDSYRIPEEICQRTSSNCSSCRMSKPGAGRLEGCLR